MPLYEIEKPINYRVGECSNPTELLMDVSMLSMQAAAVAIVLIDENGNLHTYQCNCEREDMFNCATALTEWARRMK